MLGVPPVVKWVKNPIATAWVAAEVWVGSLARSSGLKHPASCVQVIATAQILSLAQELPGVLYFCFSIKLNSISFFKPKFIFRTRD